ncbi:30S ribosomal protein S8 [candidate division WOR-1 bacterium RIFOXYD2_FULL_36_8]|uniref:Small ribosomal subunit protein uS8 n=1 Tax=candidate division WOR-1 bacterium RIFOXYB2_FULL_36_35 TaxID=1802578 RepID=A0A1F4S551_UNCSA|nr:MAG: 30S ribosomal protein S8 [candidate division WOR-1 bacterium RIFOXYA2_FULL_36_21]OGC15519.1 MAG: 30S ribosomal protein S8 [candidate division WOR-1 bacterium RIFOXYB2_FULL_36_35]OGC21304.1 MAG: 30S ribosomal protein S8 [candidate division WOR-1 bacterium RIFOXYA12_FULL_36_13]OGC38399.1 MAG: 30S ribosomal protein S8 [candidate division WOR-1 bacterium RIFOXYD2_FULL_36_8]
MREPVSEFITSVKNAILRKKNIIDIPFSKFKDKICKVLIDEGFLGGSEVLSRGGKKILRVTLKYASNKYGKMSKSVISEIKQVSRPGRRYYVGVGKIPRVQSGFGISLVSTSHGVMAGEEARKKRLGGEVLLFVY